MDLMSRQIARNAALVSLFVAGSATTALAQPSMNRGPNPNAPKLMVSACRTNDKVLAVLCADKLRAQIEGDVSFRVLYVNPKSDVENVLTASGYPIDQALATADAVALAKQLRADMYIDATVDKTASGGFKITAAAVMSRDGNLVQPLGSVEGPKIENAVASASRAFRDVFEKTFEDSRDCFTLARERKVSDAQKRVADVLKAFPRSVWAKQCNLQLLKDTRAPQDQVLKAAEELRELQPENKALLRDLVIMYDTKGDKPNKLKVLRELYASDPADAKLAADVINSLAAEGQLEEAQKVAQEAMTKFQGDLNIIQPYWSILYARQQNKAFLDVGRQMVMLDTATADSTYFDRTIRAAVADSNRTLAAETADQAGKKFPRAQFNGMSAQLWRQLGNTAKSVEASRRALAANPSAAGARAGIATALLTENPPKVDEGIALIKEMIAANEDKNQIAGLAVTAGNILRVHVDTLKARGADAATLFAANERAYAVLTWADSLAKGTTVEPQGKFLVGVVALALGQAYVTQGGETANAINNQIRAMKPPPANEAAQRRIQDPEYAKACELVKKGDGYFTIAQAAVPAGGRFNPAAAQQVMGILQQMNTYVEQSKKAYRCT
jgi:tetratricopeptide (TPR) repeat protein